MDIPKEKLLQIFVTESSDIIMQLEEDVLQLENDPNDSDLINSIFRAFHTIKGNAGMLGLNELKRFYTFLREPILEG
jgi:two-component system chemotaxis sensor kinase CheA